MKYSSFALLTLSLSPWACSAFSWSPQSRFSARNAAAPLVPPLRMASSSQGATSSTSTGSSIYNLSAPKPELLQIQDKLVAIDARRTGLAEQIALAQAECDRLLQEAEIAAANTDPGLEVDLLLPAGVGVTTTNAAAAFPIGSVAAPVSLFGGFVCAAVAARSALQNRDVKQNELKQEAQSQGSSRTTKSSPSIQIAAHANANAHANHQLDVGIARHAELKQEAQGSARTKSPSIQIVANADHQMDVLIARHAEVKQEAYGSRTKSSPSIQIAANHNASHQIDSGVAAARHADHHVIHENNADSRERPNAINYTPSHEVKSPVAQGGHLGNISGASTATLASDSVEKIVADNTVTELVSTLICTDDETDIITSSASGSTRDGHEMIVSVDVLKEELIDLTIENENETSSSGDDEEDDEQQAVISESVIDSSTDPELEIETSLLQDDLSSGSEFVEEELFVKRSQTGGLQKSYLDQFGGGTVEKYIPSYEIKTPVAQGYLGNMSGASTHVATVEKYTPSYEVKTPVAQVHVDNMSGASINAAPAGVATVEKYTPSYEVKIPVSQGYLRNMSGASTNAAPADVTPATGGSYLDQFGGGTVEKYIPSYEIKTPVAQGYLGNMSGASTNAAPAHVTTVEKYTPSYEIKTPVAQGYLGNMSGASTNAAPADVTPATVADSTDETEAVKLVGEAQRTSEKIEHRVNYPRGQSRFSRLFFRQEGEAEPRAGMNDMTIVFPSDTREAKKTEPRDRSRLLRLYSKAGGEADSGNEGQDDDESSPVEQLLSRQPLRPVMTMWLQVVLWNLLKTSLRRLSLQNPRPFEKSYVEMLDEHYA